jgi:hypothetical protein
MAANIPVIVGRTVAEDGSAISTATVLCFEGAKRLTPTAEPVALGGTFSIAVTTSMPSAITCQFAAPGFSMRTLNVVGQNDRFDAGTVVLSHSFTLSQVPKFPIPGFTRLETTLRNPISDPVDVIGLEVLGTALAATNCFDLRPAAVVKISDTVTVGKTASVEAKIDAPAQDWHDTVVATGDVEVLPCNQVRINLNIPATFRLGAKEDARLWVEIPATVERKSVLVHSTRR